jgi:small multidrug resistance pump
MRPDTWRGVGLLATAICVEIGGTIALRASDGFTRPLQGAGVLVAYILSILLFSKALEYGLPLGVAYSTLTGCGLVGATVVSTALFGDRLGTGQALGLVLILAGALLLNLPRRNDEATP